MAVPRAARKISSTGVYHVMIRGINKSRIFVNENDNRMFLYIMEKIKKDSIFKLYAYWLMGNHAHFLIKEEEVSISNIMKKLCGTYGSWFNKTHNRIGHLFQDRFKSECVETDRYFSTVVRYMLNNPLKAGFVKSPGDYECSSFNEYML